MPGAGRPQLSAARGHAEVTRVGVDKRTLLSQVIAELEHERDTLLSAHRATAEGATHEENRAEGDKDMRSTEASYLARGQALRVAELGEELLRLSAVEPRAFAADEPVAQAALVRLASASGPLRVFLLPAGAGTRVRSAGVEARVVTPASPLGSALLGARAGDAVEVERGGQLAEYEIESVE